MSGNDLQMARGAVEGGYNLAIGEPVLLQSHLDLPTFVHKGSLQYPSMDGHPDLLSELDHQLARKGVRYKHIVIANGAKQALSAAFYALKQEGKTSIQHPTPYWPSYPTLAELAGMSFEPMSHFPPITAARVITSPNNPDGSVVGKDDHELYDIWDAVYANNIFDDHDTPEPRHRMKIGSAAKLLGVSGARVGWLLTNDKTLADQARKYVEISTSGVSLLSQDYVAQCLKHVRQDIYIKSRIETIRTTIGTNIYFFNRYVAPLCDKVLGVPDSGKGMFAFFLVKDNERFKRAIAKAKVALVSGSACGYYDGWYRMNMCHNEMSYAVKKIKKEYDGDSQP